MPEKTHDSVHKKVQAIFTELAGDRAQVLGPSTFAAGITSTIAAALSGPDAEEERILHADKIAFHLTDWNHDAAFIVALNLFPERFTAEEIEAAVDMLLIHVPSHIIAAARLAGHPTDDIFKENDKDAGNQARKDPH